MLAFKGFQSLPVTRPFPVLISVAPMPLTPTRHETGMQEFFRVGKTSPALSLKPVRESRWVGQSLRVIG